MDIKNLNLTNYEIEFLKDLLEKRYLEEAVETELFYDDEIETFIVKPLKLYWKLKNLCN